MFSNSKITKNLLKIFFVFSFLFLSQICTYAVPLAEVAHFGGGRVKDIFVTKSNQVYLNSNSGMYKLSENKEKIDLVYKHQANSQSDRAFYYAVTEDNNAKVFFYMLDVEKNELKISTNNGISWEKDKSGLTFSYIKSLKNNLLVAFNSKKNLVYISNDNATTWIETNIPNNPKNYLVDMDDDGFLMISNSTRIYEVHLKNNKVNTIEIPTNFTAYDISKFDNGSYFARSEDKLLVSADTGKSWLTLAPMNDSLYSTSRCFQRYNLNGSVNYYYVLNSDKARYGFVANLNQIFEFEFISVHPYNEILMFEADHQGNLIFTAKDGIHFWNPNMQEMKDVKEGLDELELGSINRYANAYFSTNFADNGLYADTTNKFQDRILIDQDYFPQSNSINRRIVSFPEQKIFYAFDQRGLIEYKDFKKTNFFQNFSRFVNVIEDKNNKLFLAITNDAIYTKQYNGTSWTQIYKSDFQIFDATLVPNVGLVLGGRNGVYTINSELKAVRLVDSTLSSNAGLVKFVNNQFVVIDYNQKDDSLTFLWYEANNPNPEILKQKANFNSQIRYLNLNVGIDGTVYYANHETLYIYNKLTSVYDKIILSNYEYFTSVNNDEYYNVMWITSSRGSIFRIGDISGIIEIEKASTKAKILKSQIYDNEIQINEDFQNINLNQIEIYNSIGDKIQFELSGNSIIIPNQNSGMYLIQVNNNGQIFTEKFLK